MVSDHMYIEPEQHKQTMGHNKHDDTNNWIERTVGTNKHAKIDRKTKKA